MQTITFATKCCGGESPGAQTSDFQNVRLDPEASLISHFPDHREFKVLDFEFYISVVGWEGVQAGHEYRGVQDFIEFVSLDVVHSELYKKYLNHVRSGFRYCTLYETL